MRKLIRKSKGQSAVELALILPILLFLLFGIIEGGRIFAGYIELQHAARDGTRYASVHTDKSPADIKQYVKDRLVMLDPAKLDEAGNFQFQRKMSADKKDAWVELTLNYPLEIVTPIISSLTGNPFDLQVRMVMRSE